MSLYSFQKNIYIGLQGLGIGVYEYVEEKTKMPYIVIGDDKKTPYNTKMTKGWEYVATIYVVDDKKTSMTVKNILDGIENALSKNIGDLEFYEVRKMETQRIDGIDYRDIVRGIIKIAYRTEVF